MPEHGEREVTYRYVKGIVNQVISTYFDDYDPGDTTPTCFRSSSSGWWDSYQPLSQPTDEQVAVADGHVKRALDEDWRKDPWRYA
ncbi:MAG: hypothetical protein KME49_27430 [Brasilonema octagenarum HA4186-MV1]|jgi:hypothetical protein|nr:hypothetical protein [Brasilonema octagenarum HA4186-MV1]